MRRDGFRKRAKIKWNEYGAAAFASGKVPKAYMSEKLLNWYRMDNSAKLYPVMTTENSQSLFRISLLLGTKISPEPLKEAVGLTLKRFSTFNVRIRRGVFWYYFEENVKPPVVFPDNGILLQKLKPRELNDFPFRVSYFGRKLSVDFFHAVTDASGAVEFIKAIAAHYFTLTGTPISLNILDSEPKDEEFEDSFLKYYAPAKSEKLDLGQFKGKKSYKIPGETFSGLGYGLIQAIMPLKEALGLAKARGCSLTVLLTSLMMKSIAECGEAFDSPITIMVPVNLRKIFPSRTLFNFVLFVSLSVQPQKTYTLDDYIRINKAALADALEKDNLQRKINTSVKGLNLILFRFMPLPLKYAALKIGRLFIKGGSQTSILSNVGAVDLEGLDVEYMSFNLNVSKNSPVNMAAVSANGKLALSFTRAIKSAEIEKRFIRELAAEGIEIDVNSNFRECVISRNCGGNDNSDKDKGGDGTGGGKR